MRFSAMTDLPVPGPPFTRITVLRRPRKPDRAEASTFSKTTSCSSSSTYSGFPAMTAAT